MRCTNPYLLYLLYFTSHCCYCYCCFSDIDLLKEQNYQLQKTIDEKSAKVVAVEEELKKARESKVDSEVQQLYGCCLAFLLVYLP